MNPLLSTLLSLLLAAAAVFSAFCIGRRSCPTCAARRRRHARLREASERTAVPTWREANPPLAPGGPITTCRDRLYLVGER